MSGKSATCPHIPPERVSVGERWSTDVPATSRAVHALAGWAVRLSMAGAKPLGASELALRQVCFGCKPHFQEGHAVNSEWILIAGVLIVLMVVAAITQKGGVGSSEKPRRRWLLSKNEAAMYHRLLQTLPDKVILAQVSFGALLTARGTGTRNRFDRKIADFVVCDKALQVLAIVELDDGSHRGKEGKDAARDKLLQDAGYRVIRYPRIPNAEKVLADFTPVPESGETGKKVEGSIKVLESQDVR